MKNKVREYALITIGSLLVAIGIYYFLIPNNLAAGGVFGFAIVVNNFLHNVPVGSLMIGTNIILFIIGFIFIGFSFGAKTIYSSFAVSGVVWILEIVSPNVSSFTDDILVELIFGILISGLGMAIVFNQNASTGGTDIIAKILNKYYNINLGKGVLLADFFITLSAGLVYGIKVGMYALLGVIMNGFIIDSIIEGFNMCKQMVIISNKSDDIKQYIVKKLERGATVYTAKGAFTNHDKEVVITVVNRREFIKLRDYIRKIDSSAFITVNNIHEVLGEGFTQ